jgi:8-oxo-dGTP diphosphatase
MQEKQFCYFCGTRLVEKHWEGVLRRFCNQCNEPLYENPVPATCLVVIDDQEHVLLVKRSVEPKKGYWCLPGGFMELGETPEQGALRELKEETGLAGQIDIMLGVSSHPSDLYHTVLMISYLVNKYSGTLIAGDDASEAAYFQKDDLPEIAFESHRNFIRIYYSAYSTYSA